MSVITLTLLLTACATAAPVIDPGDDGSYTLEFTPADFVDRIDNPFLPRQGRW